jgi:hypothetical protein
MDKITKGLMVSYLSDYGIESFGESSDFEKFCNYCVLSKEYPETFSVDDITVGSGNDTGIDGIAVLVNGKLVDSIEEIDDLKEQNKYIEVAFIFVQAKTSSSFDGSEIGTFAYGVLDFFESVPKLVRNQIISQKAELVNHLLSLSGSMTRGLPVCKLYYVTTGRWTDDQNLTGRISSAKQDLLNTNLFEDVRFLPIGAREVQRLYQDTKSKLTTEIVFSNKVPLPEIAGVTEAYIGTLPFSEF